MKVVKILRQGIEAYKFVRGVSSIFASSLRPKILIRKKK